MQAIEKTFAFDEKATKPVVRGNWHHHDDRRVNAIGCRNTASVNANYGAANRRRKPEVRRNRSPAKTSILRTLKTVAFRQQMHGKAKLFLYRLNQRFNHMKAEFSGITERLCFSNDNEIVQ